MIKITDIASLEDIEIKLKSQLPKDCLRNFKTFRLSLCENDEDFDGFPTLKLMVKTNKSSCFYGWTFNKNETIPYDLRECLRWWRKSLRKIV